MLIVFNTSQGGSYTFPLILSLIQNLYKMTSEINALAFDLASNSISCNFLVSKINYFCEVFPASLVWEGWDPKTREECLKHI